MAQIPKFRRTNSSNPDDEPIIRLSCQVQDYSFGKKGSRSLAARYALVNEGEGNFRIDEDQEYGEIWMGDHEDGPSKSLKTSTYLKTLIERSPEAFLTDSIVKRFPSSEDNPRLPFLIKVLSFDKALPLQAHPRKSLAEWLQKQESSWKGGLAQEHGPDRDKPEIAIALSANFESFVGFRPANEIKSFLSNVEELQELAGGNHPSLLDLNDEQLEITLKEMFGRIFRKDRSDIERLTKSLLKKVKLQGDKAFGEYGERDELGYVAQKVWRQYPGDAALFAAIFFLNFVTLKRGEGISVPPGCIHAYIDGDIIECTANSDNIVSRGSKTDAAALDEADLFAKMLLQNPGPSEHQVLPLTPFPKSRNSHTIKYETPTEEFSLLKISLDSAEEEFLSIEGPTIYVVTAGEVEISARLKPDPRLARRTDTPGPTEAVASEGGHVLLQRRGSECAKTGEEGQKERLKEGMTVFVKPGYEIGFWNLGGGRAEIHAAYCEVDGATPGNGINI